MNWTSIKKLTILAMALGLLSCNGDYSTSSGVNSSSANGSGTNPNPTASTTTSNGGVACGTNEFCVNVIPPKDTTMVLHQDGTFALPCQVTAGTNTACILEADELDLYSQGLVLDYSVPAGMCSYLLTQPYFYYQNQPGIGPTQVTINVNTATGVITESDSGDGYPNTIAGISSKVTVKTPYSASPVCTTDYTSLGGPNCCGGNYSLTVATTASGVTTAVTTSEKWGGNPNNCLVGPAIDSQTADTGQPGDPRIGYPKATLTPLDGNPLLHKQYLIKSPLSKNYSSNAYISNYWASGAIGDYPLTNDGVGLGAPNAMVIPGIAAGSTQPGCYGNICTGNPWYEFDCMSPSDDLVARIRVMVRSWTSDTNFQSFIANQTNVPANGTFNQYGPEPTPFGDQPLEDYETWVTPYSSTLGPGNASCYNNGLPTQSCGFGSLYPSGAN